MCPSAGTPAGAAAGVSFSLALLAQACNMTTNSEDNSNRWILDFSDEINRCIRELVY
jgi:hypothetical protein